MRVDPLSHQPRKRVAVRVPEAVTRYPLEQMALDTHLLTLVNDHVQRDAKIRNIMT